jgi:hypothetical protein
VLSQYAHCLLKANPVGREHLLQYPRIVALFIMQHLGNVYMQNDAVSCSVNFLGHKILDLALPWAGNRKQLDLFRERKFRPGSAHQLDGRSGEVFVEIEVVLPALSQIKEADYELVSSQMPM